MRKSFVLSVLTVVMAAAPLLAQENTVKAPKMNIPERVKDFGVVPQGKVLEANFQVVNEGSEVLEIKAVRPTCGCTVADFDRQVAPGKAGMIRAKVDTKEFAGPITKSILVMTNDPDTPTTRLVVKADVQPYLEVLPRPLVRFNTIQGEEAVQKVTIVSDRAQPYEVTKVDTSVPYLKAAVRKLPKEELVPGKFKDQYEVALSLSKDAPVGPVSAEVTVHTTHPEAPKVSIRVFGVVRALVHVTPTQIQFGTVEAKVKPGRNVIVVNNREGTGLHVKKVAVDDPAFDAQVFTIAEGKRYQVTVVVKPDAPAGRHTATLTITTDDPKFPELKVPVAANIVAGSGGE